MERLKRRQDFLAAARSVSWAARGCVVQARNRDDDNPPRVGFTVTKKLGNAVIRNLVKRRLREAVRLSPQDLFLPGHDYVFIGRKVSAERPFADLRRDVETALKKLNQGEGKSAAKGRYKARPDRSRPGQDRVTA